MIITISGALGSGKSTVSKMLAQRLGVKRHYSGQIWRDLAADRGVTLYELNKMSETDPSIDREVDQRTIDLGKEYDNFIFDSHLGWHFVAGSFKVYLDVDPEEGAIRIMRDQKNNPDRSSNETFKSVKEAIRGLEKRKRTNIKRWQELYNVNIHDTGNYDLVVDTTKIPPEEVVEKIIEALPQVKD